MYVNTTPEIVISTLPLRIPMGTGSRTIYKLLTPCKVSEDDRT
jgi:hypothetical protein